MCLVETTLPVLASNKISLWGEPTVTYTTYCHTPFLDDGAAVGTIDRNPGGSAYTTAIVAALCGADVDLHGPFAHDEEGVWMLERARSLGVSVYPVTAEKSRRSVVVVDTDGKRSVVNDLRGQFDKPYADAAHFAESGLVHVSLSSLQRDKTGAVSRLLSREAQKSLLSIDAGSVQALAAYGVEDLTALLTNGGVTLLLANEAEDAYLSEVIDPQILSEIPIRVAKHGAGDTIVTVGGVARSFPVAPCAVVDTTGAGDSFAGGMIAAWSLGSSLEEAVLLGHSVARITVETTGTLPDAARVRQQVGLSRFK